ncbi:hypothetical protein CV102_10380 [Natronococcus pandeyae]|uniref:Uncharacterized protein n=1 Tax=Natronococcus pandeyae TaxID=2055836 RepID=A0A8J8TSD0_9EURY|nr:hypothetical protein [Natronococcus pandeyae]TYL38905.1 hypothetical protein CV102_10380 [Natronococcus pandeyae]
MTYADVFRRLNAAEIEYVIPRKYDHLPQRTVDENGDVDVIFEESQYERGVDVCKAAGFGNTKTRSRQLSKLGRQAIRKPVTAARLAATDQQALVAIVKRTDTSNRRHRNLKLDRGTQRLDLRDNLAYKSPMNDKRIPVHPSVTERMLSEREEKDCFYAPEPCDELAHIVPHCVFDKKGNFPPYYRDRCRLLFETVQSDDEQYTVFRDHLEKIFFEADDVVLELIREERYGDIAAELLKYHEY